MFYLLTVDDQRLGDVLLSKVQLNDLLIETRNGLISSKYRWPNGIIPYQLDMDYTNEQRDFIELALKTIESVSCVKFVRRTDELDYVDVTVSFSNCEHASNRILFSFIGLQRWLSFDGRISRRKANFEFRK